MEAFNVHLVISQIRKPAEGGLQNSLVAEITRANENIRFSVHQRTQAIYYLLGFTGAAVALGANVVTSNSFASVLKDRSGLGFAILTLAAQFLLLSIGLLAAVVYGVVFKANDALRFLSREILRLNDILYGYPAPNSPDPVNPAWVAVRATYLDTRDRHGIFSEKNVSEYLALVVYLFAMLVLVIFTIVL